MPFEYYLKTLDEAVLRHQREVQEKELSESQISSGERRRAVMREMREHRECVQREGISEVPFEELTRIIPDHSHLEDDT